MKPTPKMIEAGAQAMRAVILKEGPTTYDELSGAALTAALSAMWSDDMESAPRPDKPSKHGWPQIAGEDIAGQLAVYFWNGRAFVNPDTGDEAKSLCRWMPLQPPDAS